MTKSLVSESKLDFVPLVKGHNKERVLRKRENLYIKNMVCNRCKIFVKAALDNLGFDYATIDIGKVVVTSSISSNQRDQLKIALLNCGLELITDRKVILVERIKNMVVKMVHYSNELPQTNNSDFLSKKLGLDYTYLSNVFSSEQGISIQQFIINHRIEMVKELLSDDELTLLEISDKLHYSSLAHLANQFKKVTTVRLSSFKRKSRKELCFV